MENNEIMINEEIDVMDNEVMAEGGSGVGTGVAMLIGAGLAFAVTAGTKLVKKGIAAYKAKKELRQPDKEITVEAEQVEEVAEPEA